MTKHIAAARLQAAEALMKEGAARTMMLRIEAAQPFTLEEWHHAVEDVSKEHQTALQEKLVERVLEVTAKRIREILQMLLLNEFLRRNFRTQQCHEVQFLRNFAHTFRDNLQMLSIPTGRIGRTRPRPLLTHGP